METSVQNDSVEITSDEIFRQPHSVGTKRVLNGRSAARRQKATHDLARKLQRDTKVDHDGRIVGANRPATVVNFNPVALSVGPPLRVTIPAAGRYKTGQVIVPHRGRKYEGAYCYIDKPHLYQKMVGFETDTHDLLGTELDMPTAEPRAFSPHAIATEIYHLHNLEGHLLMGGILVFDQKIHELSDAFQARRNGKLFVPTRTMDGSEIVYDLRETTLEEELDRIFSVQLQYCNLVLQQAHNADADEDPQKIITDKHRSWARWAHKMGHIEKLPKWVSESLNFNDASRHRTICRDCGAPEVAGLLLCKCGRPYDILKAYLGGAPVGQAYLELLEGDELVQAQKEMQRRRAKFPSFTEETEQPKGKKKAE